MRTYAYPANDNRLRSRRGPTLFGSIGILLPYTGPQPTVLRHQTLGRAGWALQGVCRVLISGEPVGRPFAGEQLRLPLPPVPPRKISRAIPPACIVFMNMTLDSLFGRARMYEAALRQLHGQGLRFVGELTRLNRAELQLRLSSHRWLAHDIEHRLTAIGLGLDAKAPWWEPPADYYELAY